MVDAHERSGAIVTHPFSDERTDKGSVRGYQLLEQIGSGAFAVVWRARQTSVDREVAVKQIRTELASQPDFIRRFESEAHLVARLQHPNIVPLVDFWREPESALLVMQYLRGGTLERRLDDGPLGADDTVRVVGQVGSALAAAHQREIVHRDVKSANVLFDEHGNAYLSDFGIALDPAEADSTAAALSPGTPLYASPEQLRRERVGPAADIFSLGIVAYECLTGALPFAGSSSGPELFHRQMHDPLPDLHVEHGVDRRLAAAISRATEKDPSDRFDTVDEFVEAMSATGAGLARRAAVVSVDVANPYRGLRTFEEADVSRFFGRDRLCHELVEGLRNNGLAARSAILIGSSGSGKSSVVRAGLIPALRAGAVPGSDQWYFTSMTPGTDAFSALAEAIGRVATQPVDGLEGQLRSGPRGLLRGIRQSVGPDQTVALFVDQFEELFTDGEQESAEFLAALATSVTEADSPIRLLATMRADFYDRPLSHREFAPVLKETAVDVTPLAADELEEAIVRPADGAGVTLEPGLLASIVADTIGEPAPLPLLQYALSELYDRRMDDVMTNEAYREIGGLAGALAVRAEQIHEAATADEQQAIRRAFGRLTTSQGSVDLRCRVPVADVEEDITDRAVLKRFSDARLLSFDRDPETRAPTVEVAHEALLRAWPRLVRWLDEDRDTLRQIASVSTLADEWHDGGRSETDTLRGGRLESAEDLIAIERRRLRELDVVFIDTSTARAERERRVDASRVRRLRGLVLATGCLLVLALVAAAVAFGLRGRAERSADEALEQRDAAVVAQSDADLQTLISRSAGLAVDDPTVSVLLALEARRRAPGAATERVVLDSLTRLGPIVATHDPVPLGEDECDYDGHVALDGLHQYSSIGGRRIEHDIDAETSRDVGALVDPCAYWFRTHEGSRVVEYLPEDGTIWASEGDDPSSRVQLPTPRSFWRFFATEDGPERIALTTSETNRSEASIQIYDARTGEPVGAPIGGLAVPYVEATGDGATLVISSGTPAAPDGGGPLIFVDAETGAERFRASLPDRSQSFDFDPSTNQIIFGTGAGLITVDASTGAIVSQIDLGALVDIIDVILLPDGTVAVLTRGRLELVDRELGVLAGAGIELRNAAEAVLRPDGRILVHTGEHVNLVLDLDGSAVIDRSVPTGRTNVWVEYAAGRIASTDIGTHEVDVIDVETGKRERYRLELPDGSTFDAIVASPTADGTGDIVTFDTRGRIALWNQGRLQSMETVPSSSDGVLSTGAGGDGVTAVGAALGEGRREVALVRTEGKVEVLFRVGEFEALSTVVPAADGGLHVATTEDQLLTFDAEGRERGSIRSGVCCPTYARHDPVSGRVAFGGDRGFFVYDPTNDQVTVLDTTSVVSNVAPVRDGAQIVVGHRDGRFELWDVDARELLGVLYDGKANTLGTPTFEEETDSVWLAVPGRAIRVPLDPDVWAERACETVGRELTPEEWERYVPGDESQRPVCT